LVRALPKRPEERCRSLTRKKTMKKVVLFMAGSLLMGASPLLGQEPAIEEADLPRWVEEDIINFFNDRTTIHFTSRTRIPSTRVVLGDVAALGGPFTIAGEVDGDLVVVNGDLIFETGGVVTGDVMVVGGRIFGEELGDVGGDLRIFDEPLRYVQRGDQIASVENPEDSEGFGPDLPWGDLRFTVKSGQNYNRTEGLPIMFGPSFRTAGSNPLRLDLLAIWRTDSGFDANAEDFGWALKAEQALGGRNNVSVGGTFYSVVAPMEDWGLTNLEASLTTFVLHDDYRDYYDREGWSVFAKFRIPYSSVSLRAEYFDEEHDFVPVASPWSVTKNDEPWRLQPLIAEGDLQYLEAAVDIDTRNDRNDPSDGWLVEASLQKGLGGDFAIPEHMAALEEMAETIPAQPYGTDFLTGFLDVRTYLRINPGASLNFRGVVGGAMSDVPLPPQFQHTLGGEGSIPGYRPFTQDCGARSVERGFVHVTDQVNALVSSYPSYGCDRFALFQAEVRGRLFFDWGESWDDGRDDRGDDWTWYPDIKFSPNWSVFLNTGQAWSVDGEDAEALVDIGGGIFFGDLGLYMAYPLTGEADDVNFFIRLSRRF